MERQAVERFATGRGIWMLWLGVLLGPAGWALHLGVSYSLVLYVCRTGAVWLMHLTTAVSLLVAAAGVWIAWRSWQALGGPRETTGADVAGRSRFMAVAGLVASGFSVLLIAVEGLPNFLLDPCAGSSIWVLPLYP